MRLPVRPVVTAAVVVVALAAGVAAVGNWRGWFVTRTNAPEIDVPPSAIGTVASNLRAPWGLAFLPDGSALVTERDTARILRIAPGGSPTEVATVDEAEPGGEGGLLGIAVSPDFARDRWVYVYLTAADDNRILRLRLTPGPSPGDGLSRIEGRPVQVLTGIPKAGNHNGGRIAFGPDGMLYAGTGDAARRELSQDLASLGGKILRMTPDGQPAPGNPYPGSLVYSYGHRNVQGLAWDGQGRMYAAEFGQNRYDELNRIEAGRNYGWPEVEGTGDDDRYVNPIATWGTDEASPSGIAVSGDRVWMACLRGRRLYRIGTDGAEIRALLVGDYGRLRHVAAAPDGSLWVLTSNHDGRGDPTPTDDRILRLTP